MKKSIVFFLIIFISCILFFKTLDKLTYDEVEYYTKINYMIKDFEFYTARINDGQILFYDINNSVINSTHLDFYNKKISLIYIRKEGDRIFFISRASVDDESGIVFMNNSADDILDGIVSLERVGGNSYQFNTR